MEWPPRGSAPERIAVGLFAAASVVAVIGIHPLRAPDSPSYLRIDLFGGSQRLWTVPLVFLALPNDRWRVAVQTAVFIAAWVLLARSVATLVADRALRVVAVVALLCLGLAAVDWNVIILSESLANSLTVGLMATWLRLSQRQTTTNSVTFLAVAVLWTFTRQANVLLIVPIAVVAVVACLNRRRRWRPVAAALAVVAVWAVATVSIGHGDQPIQRFNSMAILVDRILPDAGATAYFQSKGLPVSREEQRDAGQFSPHSAVFLGDGTLVAWVDGHFLSTYSSYLATHAGWTLSGVARGVAGLPRPVEFGFTHLRRLAGVWRAVWGVGSLVVLGSSALLGMLAAAVRRRLRWTSLSVAGCVGVVVAAWWLLVVWLLSATELGRLSVSANILLRVALIILVLQSADVLLAVRLPPEARAPDGRRQPARRVGARQCRRPRRARYLD